MEAPAESTPGHDGPVATNPGPGWYPAGDSVGRLRWWDGHQWTDDFAALAVATKLPSRQRMRTYLTLAALSIVLTVAFGIWGYATLRSECQADGAADVDACVSEGSMGVDMIGSVGFIASVVFLTLGVGGLRRRRRAGRAAGRPRPGDG